MSFSSKVNNILKNYGNDIITNIVVKRAPLPWLIMKLFDIVNIATLNKIYTQNPYDKLFHLCLWITLDTGLTLLLEKNYIINMDINPKEVDNTEQMKIVLNNKILTTNELLNNTKIIMGDNFYKYQASHNNCQDFVLNILISNNLNTPNNINFVKQTTEQLFKDLPVLRKSINSITDINGKISHFMGGSEILKPNTGKNGLFDYEIKDLLSHIKNFNGVYSKDLLPEIFKNGWYVINMQNHNEGHGTHWTCFKNTPHNIFYFDAFGFEPPLQVLKDKDIIWSNKQIQNELSSACGWFCVSCIKYNELSKGSDLDKYKSFLNKFSFNTGLNDNLLKDLIDKLQ